MTNVFRNLLGDIVNPFFLEVVVRGTYTDNASRTIPCTNWFHFHRLSNGPAIDKAAIGVQFAALIHDELLAATNVGYHFSGVDVRTLDDPADGYTTSGVEDDGTVGNAASAYTSLAAVKMGCVTGARGRSFMGSKHWAGLDESQVTQCELAGGGITLWAALRDVLDDLAANQMEDANGNVWYWFVLSKTLSSLGPTDIPAVVTGADVVSVNMNLTVGSMTGRKEGYRLAP